MTGSNIVSFDGALSRLRHKLVIEMGICLNSEYEGLERALEILDEYRESLSKQNIMLGGSKP